jgi:hypothetical protein
MAISYQIFQSLFKIMQVKLNTIKTEENESIEIELQFGKLSKKLKIGDLVVMKSDLNKKVYEIIEYNVETSMYSIKSRFEERILYKKENEIELYNKKFYSGINVIPFSRIIKELNKRHKPEITITQDEIFRSIRKTFNVKTEKITYMKKEKIWNTLDKTVKEFYKNKGMNNMGELLAEEFGCRLNISKEIEMKEEIKNWNPEIQRLKKRYSYSFMGGYKLDITQVDTTEFNKNKSKNTSYELEIEIEKKSLNDPKTFYAFFNIILKMYLGTEIAYTLSEKEQVYKTILNLMGIKREKLKREDITEARDMKIEDIVDGGIVGNKNTPYDVTIKTDGKRKLMAILSNGIWLVMPGTEEMDRVTNSVPTEYINSILDGELITSAEIRGEQMKINVNDETDKFKYRYFIFDCMSYCGDQNTKNIENHFERLEKGRDVSIGVNNFLEKEYQRTQSKLIPIQLINKTFWKILSIEEFYVNMNEVFLKRNEQPYKDDGLIFTPMSTGYYCNPLSKNMINPEDRNATIMNDIIKWKPSNMRTIDLSILWLMKIDNDKNISRYLLLQTYRINEEGNKSFTPFPNVFPNGAYFSWEQIDYENEIFKNNPSESGLVYEFYWDENKNKLVPIRFREDKPLPNREDVARSVWNSIFNGVSENTLRGKSFDLMRKYHNSIKRELFDSCKDVKYLLDIGSGRGGDLMKWKNFEKVIAVEPNEEHIEQFKSRMKKGKPKNEIIIVKAGGEEYELIEKAVKKNIPGGKVDVVSIMLSMSFFDNVEKRANLYLTITNNLKIGGEIIYVTIDGDAVKQLFDPILYEPSIDIEKIDNRRLLNIINAKLEYEIDTNFLNIDIPNTIVKDQRERPPFLGEILSEAPYLYELKRERATKQKFLSFSEKILSNLYTYGKMKLLNRNVDEVEIEYMIELGDGLKGISLIKDNFTVLHGILKYLNEEYQNDTSLLNRLTIVNQFYDELMREASNDSLKMKPVDGEAIEEICNLLKIRIMKDDKKYGKEGIPIVIYDNMLMIKEKFFEIDQEDIPDKYENTCDSYLVENTFSKFLNKVIKDIKK